MPRFAPVTTASGVAMGPTKANRPPSRSSEAVNRGAGHAAQPQPEGLICECWPGRISDALWVLTRLSVAPHPSFRGDFAAMKRSQITIAIVAVFAVALVAIISAGGGSDDGGGGKSGGGGDFGGKAPAGSIRVSFAYSPEKEALLKPLIQRFNESGKKVDGKPVFVEGSVVASGDAERKIARGRLQPVAWSPASSLWGRLLNFEADRQFAADDNPSIVRTPLVIAMWEPMARALGYPRKALGFRDVLSLATSNQGWARYGKPQYGKFKLVHTNPDFSTSGLSAVVAEYYAATGKKEGLVPKDVSGAGARKQVRDIERSIVHYGDTTLFIADQMRRKGPGYASA